MTERDTGDGFYEEDEPTEKILAAFEAGTKALTSRPGQTQFKGRSYWKDRARGQETRQAGVPHAHA